MKSTRNNANSSETQIYFENRNHNNRNHCDECVGVPPLKYSESEHFYINSPNLI